MGEGPLAGDRRERVAVLAVAAEGAEREVDIVEPDGADFEVGHLLQVAGEEGELEAVVAVEPVDERLRAVERVRLRGVEQPVHRRPERFDDVGEAPVEEGLVGTVAGEDFAEDLRVGLAGERHALGRDRDARHVGEGGFDHAPSDAVRREEGAVDVEKEELHRVKSSERRRRASRGDRGTSGRCRAGRFRTCGRASSSARARSSRDLWRSASRGRAGR